LLLLLRFARPPSQGLVLFLAHHLRLAVEEERFGLEKPQALLVVETIVPREHH
jgi:hypothetical protein